MAQKNRYENRKPNRGDASGRGGNRRSRRWELYDLRETEDHGSAPVSDEPEEVRPYRERHRVEVGRETGPESRSIRRSGTTGSGPEADLFPSSRGNAFREGRYQRSAGRNVENEEEGERIAPRRVVRGNRPGVYRETDRTSRGGTADLFVYEPRRSGRGSRRYGTRQQNRTGVTGSGSASKRSAERELYSERDRFEEWDLDSVPDRVEEWEHRSAPDGFEENKAGSASRDPDRSRASRRAQKRRERERQLRKTYTTIGLAAVVLILVLVFAVRFAVGLVLKRDKAAAGEMTAGAASTSLQAEADPARIPDPSSEEEENVSADAEKEKEDPETVQSEEMPETGSAERVEDADPEGSEGDGSARTDSDQTDPDQTDPDQTDSDQTDPDQTGSARTAIDPDDWRLILVNPWHQLPEGYTIETTTLPNGESVDSRCYQALMDMLEDCRNGGGTPIVCSSYRPHTKQVELYEAQVQTLISRGMDRQQAETEAGTVVAVPGTSEHELGLAVDICDTYNQLLDETQADTPTQQWLMENCWYYGFILRYPLDKSELTGIIYEPWHYRYVGVDAAEQIHERGICLEEYLAAD